MLPFKLVYHDGYDLQLVGHVFPSEKFRLVRDVLLAAGDAEPANLLTPEPASDEDILRVHTKDYLEKLTTGALSATERMRLEIPSSPEVVLAFRLAAGGSILAGRCALQDGFAVNLGGGFHHAFPAHGEGFCMINDVAVAIRRLQADGAAARVMVIDTDVHQGNGTAAIFLGDPTVFTISLHQQNNYPVPKQRSSIDVNLADGTRDDEYLRELETVLEQGFDHFCPDLIFCVAGADPYQQDRLGGLSLSVAGLRERDSLVFREARRRGVPVATTFAGGYARQVEDTVRIHVNTVLAAAAIANG